MSVISQVSYLPADIFARYERLRGNNVLMVSGSDCHGTPITLEAERQGITPQDVIRRNHPSFVNTLDTLGVTFDLFTQTYTDNHYRTTTEYLHALVGAGVSVQGNDDRFLLRVARSASCRIAMSKERVPIVAFDTSAWRPVR